MKISDYAIRILKKIALIKIYRYIAFIYMPINMYPIILVNLVRKVWLNYSEVTLNFVAVHVFLITEAGTKIYATA